jgi:DNA-binding GntR family transcriptional regulator
MDDGLDALIRESAAERRNGNRRNMNIPTGKAGEIVAELERRLIMGYYKAGESLSFKMLAETFEVSRQPVSAAIGHLRASGYVEVLPQVGCRVVKPSRVELAVERRTKSGVAQLRSIKPPPVKDLGAVPARAAYIRYIDAFHDQVWAMAKAPMLEGQFRGMRNLASFYLWQGTSNLAPQIANVLNQERTKIADLIAAGDREGAANLMRSHILGKPALVFD